MRPLQPATATAATTAAMTSAATHPTPARPGQTTRLRLAAMATTVGALISGCALPGSTPPPQVFDLGPLPALALPPTAPPAFNARLSAITAPAWLAHDGIAYRLNAGTPQQLAHYRDSRWAAAPAALLTPRLRQHLLTQPGCSQPSAPLLAVELDTFEQRFQTATASEAVLGLHATLWPAGPDSAPLHQRWEVQRPAPTADARGGVQAMSAATEALLPQVAAWARAQACR